MLSIFKEPKIQVKKGIPLASSIDVADYFGKRRDNVYRDVENLIQELMTLNEPDAEEGTIDVQANGKQSLNALKFEAVGSGKQSLNEPKFGLVGSGKQKTPALKFEAGSSPSKPKKQPSKNQLILIDTTGPDFVRQNFLKSEYKDEKGESRPMYLMTKKGFELLAMRFRGKKALRYQISYVNAFEEMEKALLRQKDQDWQEARETGKLQRKLEVDAIKMLEELYKEDGSAGAKWIYVTATRVIYSELGLIQGKEKVPPKFRDYLTKSQLNVIENMESIFEKAIIDGKNAGLSAKEIYQLAKSRIREYVSLIPERRYLPQYQDKQIAG